jgi:hypothetical protein
MAPRLPVGLRITDVRQLIRFQVPGNAVPGGDAPADVSEPGNVPASCRAHEDGAACADRLAALESRWTALPNRARSIVGEYPGGLNDTGTDAGSVLNAELAGSAPPQADGIVR